MARGAAVLPAGARRACRTLALLPEEPEGRIPTLTAGAIEIRATLNWRSGEMPRETALPGFPYDERVRCSLVREDDEPTASRNITGDIRAFTGPEMSKAVESVLRAISAAAALSEAVLEARAIRIGAPTATPAAMLETLARDLRDAGFPVGFGRSWSPAPNSDAAVGIGDPGTELAEFLRGHPSWEPLAGPHQFYEPPASTPS